MALVARDCTLLRPLINLVPSTHRSLFIGVCSSACIARGRWNFEKPKYVVCQLHQQRSIRRAIVVRWVISINLLNHQYKVIVYHVKAFGTKYPRFALSMILDRMRWRHGERRIMIQSIRVGSRHLLPFERLVLPIAIYQNLSRILLYSKSLVCIYDYAHGFKAVYLMMLTI